jgi:DNA-binding transcriptional MerR regulator
MNIAIEQQLLHSRPVSDSHSSSKLPPAAHLEFTKVSQADWQGSVPLAELLDRVNRVAATMTGDDDRAKSTASRVKPTFTERSFRHYQTLGCIDAPDKRGRLASYGFRHFLQALLVRRLLSERVPAEQIATLLTGCGTEELERMLLGGVEIVARAGGGGGEAELSGSVAELVEIWNRVRLAPGLELHLSLTKLSQYKPEDFRRLRAQAMARLKDALRRQGS